MASTVASSTIFPRLGLVPPLFLSLGGLNTLPPLFLSLGGLNTPKRAARCHGTMFSFLCSLLEYMRIKDPRVRLNVRICAF